MTRWKKDETVFCVKVFKSRNRDGSESRMCTIPLPLMDRFGECESIQFTVTDDGVSVEGVMPSNTAKQYSQAIQPSNTAKQYSQAPND